MSETKPEIRVVSTGDRRAEIVVLRRGGRGGTLASETRHLWRSPAANGYTDREGNIYRERGGGLYVAGHVKHGLNPAEPAEVAA